MSRKPIDLNTLSEDLKQHIVQQDYSLYTPIDHACWRFIMRVNLAFYKDHAHPLYLEGLKKTGIPVDRIPKIQEMDECLQKFGWRAVAVSGFIPPAVFLDLQAKGILTIACDMRSIEHIAYTPAPDIVHEAAGHAPIIADPEYADYLQAYGEVSERTIFSKEDMDVYEAIRHLSIVKEDPKSTPADIENSQKQLDQALASVFYVSEATQLSRMAWWTTEYGLVGALEKPLIYGAGLLSSAGESYACLNPEVKKIPLTLDCVLMGYDITKPQPHLYIASDFKQLQNVLQEFAATTAYKKGGLYGLAKAKAARTVATVEFDNGLQVGGIVEDIFHDSERGVYKIIFAGDCQLAFQDKELRGGDPKSVPSSFSIVIQKAVTLDLQQQLDKMQLKKVFTTEDSCQNQNQQKSSDKKTLMTWLQNPQTNESVFVIHAKSVKTVYGGAPDREKYFLSVGQVLPKQKHKTNLTEQNKKLCQSYAIVRHLRNQFLQKKDEEQIFSGFISETELESEFSIKNAGAILPSIWQQTKTNYPQDWLLTIEILEMSDLLKMNDLKKSCTQYLQEQLQSDKFSQDVKSLIRRGLN